MATFNSEMEELRRRVREFGWLMLEEMRIPQLVKWLDMVIFRWRLRRNIRRHLYGDRPHRQPGGIRSLRDEMADSGPGHDLDTGPH